MPLTEIEISEAKEAFTLFDVESMGQIRTDKIATALRSLGYTPSAVVLAAMEQDADQNKTGWVKLGDFLRQVEKAVGATRTTDSADQLQGLLEGLNFFFSETIGPNDLVSVETLKHVLKTSGEKISKDELDEFFRDLVQFAPGQVKFADFVALLTNICSCCVCLVNAIAARLEETG